VENNKTGQRVGLPDCKPLGILTRISRGWVSGPEECGSPGGPDMIPFARGGLVSFEAMMVEVKCFSTRLA